MPRPPSMRSVDASSWSSTPPAEKASAQILPAPPTSRLRCRPADALTTLLGFLTVVLFAEGKMFVGHSPKPQSNPTVQRKATAPPVYRPTQSSGVQRAAAPPVYRPTQSTGVQRAAAPPVYRPAQSTGVQRAIAPPVYRPGQTTAVQRAAAPPVYRPAQSAGLQRVRAAVGQRPNRLPPSTIQRVMAHR